MRYTNFFIYLFIYLAELTFVRGNVFYVLSELDSRLSVLVWLAMLVSFSIIVTFPRPSGIRTFVGSTILRLIFSLGLEPTLRILGLANVRMYRLLDLNASANRPVPICPEPHYENEAKCKVSINEN